jgi:taurine dioxygenase
MHVGRHSEHPAKPRRRSMGRTAIGVQRIAGALGAEVTGVDLSRDLDDGTVAAIRAAWL